MKLFSLLLLALFALSPLAAQAQVPQVAAAEEDDEDPPAPSMLGCQPSFNREVFVEILDQTPNTQNTTVSFTVEDMNGNQIGDILEIGERPKCDFYWEFAGALDGAPADIICSYPDSTCPYTTYKITIAGVSYIYSFSRRTSGSTNSFFGPGPLGSTPDITFVVLVHPGGSVEVKAGGLASSYARANSVEGSHYEDCFSGDYVIPYYNDYIENNCRGNTDHQTGWVQNVHLNPTYFLSRSSSFSDFTFASEADVVIDSRVAGTWDEPGLTLRFPQGRKLVVEDDLEVKNATLMGLTTSSTWGGVRVESGGDATFSNQSFIDDAGVTVTSGTFTLDDSIVRDATGYGVYATGSSSQAYIQNEAQVNDSGSYGVYAVSGADIDILDGAQVNRATWRGARASGSGSTLLIDGATIFDATAVGVDAYYYADVDFNNTTGAVSIDQNSTSLLFDMGADFQSTSTHSIIKDGPSNYDVAALWGAYVVADNNYWGSGVTQVSHLDTDVDYATLIINNVSVTPPASVTNSEPTPEIYASTPAVAGAQESRLSTSPSERSPFASALGSDTVQGWIETAEQAYRAGDLDEAVNAAALSVARATTSGDRLMAWTAASRLAIRIQSSPETDGSTAWTQLAGLATGSLSDRDHAPWARRTLALGEAMSKQAGAHGRARAHVASLLGMENASRPAVQGKGSRTALSHAGFGQLLLLRLALDENDQTQALAASVALVALDTEQAEMAAFQTEAVFPNSNARQAVAQRIQAARQDARHAEIQRADAPLGFAVAPNPTAGPTQLSYSLSSPSEVQITVYDELGRQVAVVTESGSVGQHTSHLDMSDLPSGVYLARLNVHPSEGEGTASETRRFTIIR